MNAILGSHRTSEYFYKFVIIYFATMLFHSVTVSRFCYVTVCDRPYVWVWSGPDEPGYGAAKVLIMSDFKEEKLHLVA